MGERGAADGAPPAGTGAGGRLPALLRFDGVERAVHWANAALFGVLVATGAALYFTPLTSFIGRRVLVERVHVYAGLALPVPLLLALSGSWGRGLRRDLARLNRWSRDDRRWLRAVLAGGARRRRGRPARVGKFNPGQKLNAAFTAGGGLVMLGTGCLLRWYRPFPLSWRSGATLVHNSLAAGFVVVIAGHVLLALSDSDALGSMLTGRVDRRWAGAHAPVWLEEAASGTVAGTADPPGRAER